MQQTLHLGAGRDAAPAHGGGSHQTGDGLSTQGPGRGLPHPGSCGNCGDPNPPGGKGHHSRPQAGTGTGTTPVAHDVPTLGVPTVSGASPGWVNTAGLATELDR